MTITLEEIKKLREFVANELGRREDDCFEKSGPVWQSHVVPAREALSIVEKLPGMLEEYTHLREENALCENDPCWEYRYRAEAAEGELEDWRKSAEHGPKIDELRAENDALAAKVASLSPHGSCGCSYDKPGDLCMHHSPQLAAEAKRANELTEECRALRAELAKAREALTPSAETKAAYMCEFKFRSAAYPESDETVPWTTIKEIMAAIRARAALASEGGAGA